MNRISERSNKGYIYYTEADIERALDYDQCDILLLHDWPKGIIAQADVPLLQGRRRSTIVEDIGNEYTYMLIEALKPKVVACGHMHYRYRNTLQLETQSVEICCAANVESGRDSVILLRDDNLNVLE